MRNVLITLGIVLSLVFSGICLADDSSVFDAIGMSNTKTETQKLDEGTALGFQPIGVAVLGDKAPDVRTEISITNEERLTIENVQLKLQVLQGQLDSFVKQLVAKYKIDMQGWSYDVVGGKFVKIKQGVKE